ncbi:MAG: SGNH/GDSL hydrolase family protein [Gammaproteobacteria bacterium]|nr:SGNH/GDSL hydrolase family protein [Gammaproteobacteria bacterium]
MLQILVYADSLSWGIIPDTRERLPFDQRWPGVMENELAARGIPVRVIEDCLNGRRTVFEDPYKPGRNGLTGLAQRIEVNSPLSLVILMLGTNDLQSMHPHTAWHAAQGVATLVRAIRGAPVEPGMPVPPVLIIAPPAIGNAKGTIAPKFLGSDKKCAGLADEYSKIADELDCYFLDAGLITPASPVDGVHLDADQHAKLGDAVAGKVTEILENM